MKKIIFMLFLLSIPFFVFSDWNAEKAKIEYLISSLEKLDAVFIRNKSEHTPTQAGEHLRGKLKSALDSWFTPKKEDWTAKLFIDKVASKSFLSGKEYQIRFKDKKIVTTQVWLTAQLNKYKKHKTIKNDKNDKKHKKK